MCRLQHHFVFRVAVDGGGQAITHQVVVIHQCHAMLSAVSIGVKVQVVPLPGLVFNVPGSRSDRSGVERCAGHFRAPGFGVESASVVRNGRGERRAVHNDGQGAAPLWRKALLTTSWNTRNSMVLVSRSGPPGHVPPASAPWPCPGVPSAWPRPHRGEQGAVLPAVLVQAAPQNVGSPPRSGPALPAPRHGGAPAPWGPRGPGSPNCVTVSSWPTLSCSSRPTSLKACPVASRARPAAAPGRAAGAVRPPGPVPVAAVGSTNDDDEQRRCQYQQRQ